MEFKEIIVVYFQNHKEPINVLCMHKSEALNIKNGNIYSYHCFKGLILFNNVSRKILILPKSV
jgi:hypothetical protein